MHKRLTFTAAIIIIALAAIPVSARRHRPISIRLKPQLPLRFIAYGDTRFTDPANTNAANADVRQQLVRAIADVHPDFVTFGGDIAYNGDKPEDWQVYDRETGIWRERRIPVYPALGNHDLHGDLSVALGNYFARFPALRHNRFYSVRGANWIMLTLDSALDESSGPQGRWLHYRLNHLPAGTTFVFIVLHHPPYTSSSDEKTFGGGHSARPAEQKMAAYLEAKQKTLRARIVVFAGHVHNYERHEHGGVTYFVTGGGGAHAYPITRVAGDPFQSSEINYHYLLVEIRRHSVTATMNRLELKDGVATWTQPDSVTISSTQARSVAKETAAK
ncbi:MAG TPA: metallophosphoesterase [Blastocatellia bacterium]|nr:metallophosphoesterase [Blastocatellia bacterium]